MSVREYIGARYVPLFADPIDWDNTLEYEPLTVVLDQGASYVSRQWVPAGVDILNTDYWILWADYNAQIAAYRAEVQAYDGRITQNANDIDALEDRLPKADFTSVNTVSKAIGDLGDLLPESSFDSVNTVAKAISDLSDLLPATSFDSVNTVNKAIGDLSSSTAATFAELASNYGFACHVHASEGCDDTSWVHIALPREYVSLEPHNMSGSDANPKALSGNPLSYAKATPGAFVVTNANYGGANYPMRFAGTDIAGDVLTRPYLALSSTSDPKWYPIGTDLAAIPSLYETVYACDALLVDGGVITNGLDNHINEPRQVFGWDDNSWHILTTEGRGTMEKGIGLADLAQICYDLGIENAVNLDGGGSTATVVNTSHGTIKVNRGRDFSLAYNNLRDVGVGHVYSLKSADIPESILDSAVASYRGTPNGYTGYRNYLLNTSTQALDPTLNYVNIPTVNSRNVSIFNQYRFSESYVYPSPAVMMVPIPAMRYATTSIYCKACGDLQFPAGSVTANATIAITIARYSGGTRQTASRRRIIVPASADVQRVMFSTDYEFTLTKANETQEESQDEYALEITVTNGTVSAMNLEGCYMEVHFDAPIV